MKKFRAATQDWTHEIPIMQQSVLLSIVRGPDGFEKYHPVKPILRWYRRCILISAVDGIALTRPDTPGGGSFTGPSYKEGDYEWCWQNAMNHQFDDFIRTMDAMPIHFYTHMMHAFEIVGYKHPDHDIRAWFHRCYERMVNALHLFPETEEQLDYRLGDTLAGWRARTDDATETDPSSVKRVA